MVSPHTAGSLNLGATVTRTAGSTTPEAPLDPGVWQRLMDDPASFSRDDMDRLLAAWHADPAVRQTWLAHNLTQEALQGPVHAPLMSSAAFLHEFQQRRNILPLDESRVPSAAPLKSAVSLPGRLRQAWLSLQRGRYTWPVLSAVTACALTVLALPALQRNADLAPGAATPVAAPASPAAAAPDATPAADPNQAASTPPLTDSSLSAEDSAAAIVNDAAELQGNDASAPRYGRSLGSSGWSTGSLNDTGYVGQGFRWQHSTVTGTGLTGGSDAASTPAAGTP